MDLHNEQHLSIRRYLLGELSEQEVENVEQLLMSDNEVYQELLTAEDDLIDDYVSGALSEEEQSRFKRRFLAVPELRQSVRSTSVLKKYALNTAPQIVAEEPAPGRPTLFIWLKKFFMQPAFAVSFAALLLAAIALNAWLFRQNSQLQSRVAQLEAQQATPGVANLQEQLTAARLRNEELSAELTRQQQLLAEESRKLQLALGQKEPTPGPGGSRGVLAVALTSGFVRDSGEWTKFSLQPDTREVSFRLDVAGNDYRSYQATLQTIEGNPKWSSKDLKFKTGNFIAFNVPSRILIPGDYRVVLNGVSASGTTAEISSYYFRVLK